MQTRSPFESRQSRPSLPLAEFDLLVRDARPTWHCSARRSSLRIAAESAPYVELPRGAHLTPTCLGKRAARGMRVSRGTFGRAIRGWSQGGRRAEPHFPCVDRFIARTDRMKAVHHHIHRDENSPRSAKAQFIRDSRSAIVPFHVKQRLH